MRKFKTEKFTFNEYEMSVINGLMLGDGHIDKNAFHLDLISSSLQHLISIKQSLNEKIWTDGGIHTYKIYDKRTNKTNISNRLLSKSNEFFYDLREKWYSENVKIIPSDIKIDKTTLLIWYLGDGCILQNNKKKITSGIKLCTNSFKEKDIENILLPQLSKYHAHIMLTETNLPIIIIPRRYCDEFLKDIGEAPFEDYMHKWNIFPYKNKNIEKNGIKTHKDLKDVFISEYLENKKIQEIANKYGVDSTVVIHYCKQEGIYQKGRDKKIYEIKQDDKVIAVTDNLKKFCNDNKLCYECMISLCNMKISKYKNYKIRKING